MERFLPQDLRQTIKQSIDMMELATTQLAQVEPRSAQWELFKQQLTLANLSLRTALLMAEDRALLVLQKDNPSDESNAKTSKKALGEMSQKASPLFDILQSKDSTDTNKQKAKAELKDLANAMYAQVCPSGALVEAYEPVPDADFEPKRAKAEKAAPAPDVASRHTIREMVDLGGLL